MDYDLVYGLAIRFWIMDYGLVYELYVYCCWMSCKILWLFIYKGHTILQILATRTNSIFAFIMKIKIICIMYVYT